MKMVCPIPPRNGFGHVTNQIIRTGVAIGVNKVNCLITQLGLQSHGKTKIAANRYGKSGCGLEGDVNGDGTH